jgi:hypothetical protein
LILKGNFVIIDDIFLVFIAASGNAELLKNCFFSLPFPQLCLFERFLMNLLCFLLSHLILDLIPEIEENEY